jgi:hypothetical protein
MRPLEVETCRKIWDDTELVVRNRTSCVRVKISVIDLMLPGKESSKYQSTKVIREDIVYFCKYVTIVLYNLKHWVVFGL